MAGVAPPPPKKIHIAQILRIRPLKQPSMCAADKNLKNYNFGAFGGLLGWSTMTTKVNNMPSTSQEKKVKKRGRK